MHAVCRAFSHYERVDPEDHWLPKFQSYDGLIIQMADQENCNQLHEQSEDR